MENKKPAESTEAAESVSASKGGKSFLGWVKGFLGTGEQSALLGAAFLMFTSAIGPGFLTQTSTFAQQYKDSFGIVILVSTIISLIAQIVIWKVVAASKMRAQDLANKVLPGLGYVIAFLVGFGGFVFCLGHASASALSMNILFGLDYKIGSLIIGVFGIVVFAYKNIGVIVDKFCTVTGLFMIVIIVYLGFASHPPVGLALKSMLMPKEFPLFPTITLIGGTVGGFICFSGAHRLVDAGITGQKNLNKVTRYATLGMVLTTIIRIMLFLAALSTVIAGVTLDPSNPCKTVFSFGLGAAGAVIFAILLMSEALNSLVGAAYTSVSFLKTLSKTISKHERLSIVLFIALSVLVFDFVGQPVKLLVIQGVLNAFVLPLTMTVLLIAARRKDIVGEFKLPIWQEIGGWLVVAISAFMVIASFSGIANFWLSD